MARSNYIYIIKHGDEIDSAFTVKHEMESYLNSTDYLDGQFKPVTILRLRDGGEDDSVDITDKYFKLTHE